MLKIKSIKTSKANGLSGSMAHYLGISEYYRDKDGRERSSSEWFGHGAEKLGLTGTVDSEMLLRLCEGYAPDGSKLRQTAGKQATWVAARDREGNPRLDAAGKPMGAYKTERIGFDCTFSAPKSLSILYAMGASSDNVADRAMADKLLSVHQNAVRVGMSMLEKHGAQTRRGHAGKDVHAAEGLIVSMHTHFAAREHDKLPNGEVGDSINEQLHTHCLVQNAVLAEGRFSALEADEMYAMHRAVGQLYRNELAVGLRKLGYTVVADRQLDRDGHEHKGLIKVAGVPDTLIQERSGRRKQILEYMKQHPEADAQEATLATRASKDEPPFAELVKRWAKDFDDFRQRNPMERLPESILDVRHAKIPEKEQEALARDAELDRAHKDQVILAELHETLSVWRRVDLMKVLAEKNVGLTAAQVMKETSAFLVRNELAIIEPEAIHRDDKGKKLAKKHTQVRFADPKVVEQERELVRGAVARKNEAGLDPKIVANAIEEMEQERGFKLSAEQRAGVEWATVKTGGVCILQGRAGTGKTVSALASVKAFKASGYDIVGCASGWDAAKKLESECGVASHSIASLVSKLDKGKMKLSAKSLVLIDEAGMVGTPSLSALLRHAHEAKAKVICQGDVLQLQSVERGSPMRAMAEAIGSVTLKDIRRQRSTHDKDTADLYYAAGGAELRSRRQNQEAGQKIMARMEKRGQLQGYEDREQAMKVLVQDYAASPRPARDKLVLGCTREDVEALNRAIREVHRARGERGSVEHMVPMTNPRSGQVQPIALAEHDRIRFTKKSDELGVVNGTKAVLIGLVPHPDGSFLLRAKIESDIKGQDGRLIEFNSNSKGVCVDYGFVSTVHKAQGQSVEEVYHLGHRSMTDRQLSLVSFTRMKSSYAVYGAASELFDRSGDAAHATDRLQTNALTEGLSKEFGGRTTTQVMADIAKEKALHATEKALGLAAQTPKAKCLAKASAAIKQASPEDKAKQRAPVQTSPEHASLVQRAATAFKTVASRMRTAVLAHQREVEQQLAQQRKRTRSMAR